MQHPGTQPLETDPVARGFQPRLGALYLGEGRCSFRVWAPRRERVAVHLVAPDERRIALTRTDDGYHEGLLEQISPGTRYLYELDEGLERPDPASRFQPDGIHGPSVVVDRHFDWTDGSWFGIPLSRYVIYEVHVGAYTPEGTFEALIPHLERLRSLGVTALEIMPVSQFPGDRNWGYDGVYPFAAQNSYGGPDGLKRLVDACHRHGLAAILDVVYNHFGPEGSYINDFGPYFTDRYRTPWGSALNFDGASSDEVRRFFTENALTWLSEFHFDALRLDAIHAMLDFSAGTFLEELAVAVHELSEQLNRRLYLIAESDRNDARVVRPAELGGYGLDAQWNDDFHHALHVLLTGERDGYYQDFGELEHVVTALREGFIYSGQYSAFRQRRHGTTSSHVPAGRLVVFSQNHDQVGNRMLGDRLSALVDFEALQLAAGLVVLSPNIPFLFMGEEYGEAAPFLYFVSHTDPALIEAVRKGRREEFAAFVWQGEPPDPEAEETFLRSKLDHTLREEGRHACLYALYHELLRLRREVPALASLDKDRLEVLGFERERVLFLRRWKDSSEIFVTFNFSDERRQLPLPVPAGRWRRMLDSSDTVWRLEASGTTTPEQIECEGSLELELPPRTFTLYMKERRL